MSFLHYRKRKSTIMYMQTKASIEIAKKISKRGTICGTREVVGHILPATSLSKKSSKRYDINELFTK